MINVVKKLLTKTEKKKYVLSIDKDYEILFKIKQLEKMDLNKQEKSMVTLIKSQLEQNWRTGLMKELDKIVRKYTWKWSLASLDYLMRGVWSPGVEPRGYKM